MDRFLRSLLISSDAASAGTDKPVSEIARSVLVNGSSGDPKSLREKAGLLALLNLLGIVETFYKEMPAPGCNEAGSVRGPVIDSVAKAPAPDATSANSPVETRSLAAVPEVTAAASPGVGTANSAPEPHISMASSLARFLGSMQPPAQPEAGAPAPGSAPTLSNMLAGLDPALIAGLLSAVASMARPRAARAPIKVEAQASNDAPNESGTATAEPAEAAPPSPLQQILGIDPKVLTLALNVLAEFMKSRPAEQKERPSERVEELPALKPTQTESRAPQTPSGRRTSHRLHKPGLGIYRSPRTPARAEPQAQPQGDCR